MVRRQVDVTATADGRTPPDPPPAPWEGTAYARYAGHHRSADDWFLDTYHPTRGDVVIDLGCGSGEFTARLAALVPEGAVLGVEPDASMVATAARHQAPNLGFVRCLAEAVDDIVAPGAADLVVSRAMLHWLPPRRHPRLFTAIAGVLRPGGVLHLESGGAGNIPKVLTLLESLADRHHLPAPPPMPETGLVLEAVEASGLEVGVDGVRTVAQRRRFSREDLQGMLRWQATTVLTRHADPSTAEALRDEAVARVDELVRHDGSFDQTFVRLEILARRPG